MGAYIGCIYREIISNIAHPKGRPLYLYPFLLLMGQLLEVTQEVPKPTKTEFR